MKYKPGDEVFIKAEITDVSDCSERPYFVAPDCRSINWVSEDKIIPMDKTYEMGLTDAWELAKKVVCSVVKGGFSCDEFEKRFGDIYTEDVFVKYTAEEALAKIESYEKKNEIKAGDVVYYSKDGDISMQSIVTKIEGNVVYTVYSDGSCGREYYPNDLKKTGKHIDIESLLRQIGE